VQSADGQNRLQLGVTIHADARFGFGDDAGVLADAFAIRRGRASLRGRVAGRFEFVFSPDFAGGAGIQDAYIETRFSPAFRLRFGKAKTPFGHERLQGVNSLMFLERALSNGLAPNRDIGLQALGDVAGGLLSYAGGVVNGVRDGGSSDGDSDDNKELAGRVVVRPWTRSPSSPLAGLGAAISATTARQMTAAGLPVYRTPVFQQTFLSYTGATADGRINRISPHVFYYRGAFGGFGDFVQSRQPVRRGDVAEPVTHRAWQVAASWVLTGESAADTGVQPRRAFDFGQGGWGALQVAARYHAMSVDRAAIDLGLAAPGSSGRARAWSAGVNWYLSRTVKYVFLFERTTFTDHVTTEREPETVFAFRTLFAF
jgi:phosphate-selective porin OprO/OprP